MTRIGILHPGDMGISLAASAIKKGHEVFWLSPGRSGKTRARAEQHNLREMDGWEPFCRTCEVILSICPPSAAEDMARAVIDAGFKGLYVDANAISPQRAVQIGQSMEAKSISFVDGAIIGGPAWSPYETRMYLCGEQAHRLTACFADGLPETVLLGRELGKASALKMCYAAYTKGTTALLCAILAAAEKLEVREELGRQWEIDDEGSLEQIQHRVRRVTAKAWRFEGEMREIAATLRAAGLPDGFHEAAAEVYQRMAGLKEAAEIPPLPDVLAALLDEE